MLTVRVRLHKLQRTVRRPKQPALLPEGDIEPHANGVNKLVWAQGLTEPSAVRDNISVPLWTCEG
jgi:hypothetical protein